MGYTLESQIKVQTFSTFLCLKDVVFRHVQPEIFENADSCSAGIRMQAPHT